MRLIIYIPTGMNLYNPSFGSIAHVKRRALNNVDNIFLQSKRKRCYCLDSSAILYKLGILF